MRVLVLSADDVRARLTPDDCRELMRQALMALAEGQVFQPLRTVVRPPRLPGLISLMPTHRGGGKGQAVFGMKSVCVFEGNSAAGKDSHQGVVTLFDPETGEPRAVVNASAITQLRTAAVSALATDVLARKNSTVLTIIGSGVQAREHAVALSKVREFAEVRVVSRDPERARKFAGQMAGVLPGRVEAFESPQKATEDADVVVTATSATDPVLFAPWVRPGTHVNAVGSSVPSTAELDADLLAAGTLVVDRLESLLNESGDYLRAAEAGVIGPDDVHGELGEILTGAADARTSEDEITVFKSLGLAIEDVVVAQHLYADSVAAGRGQWVDF